MKRLLSIATLNMTNSAPGVDQESDDIALMAGIANGDRNAFQVFLSRHIYAVVQFARRYMTNLADAEDIAQETFFRTWQKAATWTPQGHSPRSWLYRIAYNLCIDEVRKRPGSEEVTSHTTDCITDTLETTLESTAELEQLAHSLKQLPERQHTAISLCALQGLSNKEAAATMDISVDALESLLSRGRRQLRSLLQLDGEHRHE